NSLLNYARHYASWLGFLQTFTTILIEILPRLILRLTDFISPIGRIVSGLKLLYNTAYHLKGFWTPSLCFIVGACTIGLGIFALPLLLPTFGLIFATANIACNAFLGLFFIGKALKNKFWGQWSKERALLDKEEKDFYKELCDPGKFEKYKKFKNAD